MKQYWLRESPPIEELRELTTYLGSEALARIFWYRNLRTIPEIQAFSKIADISVGDDLYNVKQCTETLLSHKSKGSKVVIYGDYDADGAVAASILFRFLSRVLEMNVTVYIPERHEEGYGLNYDALIKLAQQGADLVISVDCGVRDKELIERVTKETKMEIIVTDHHQPGDTFPTCCVVHPLYPGHEAENKYTSGGVVVWKIVRYVEEFLHLTHEFSDSVVDLAGISLVTDIMPLLGENRVILKRAIQKMRVSPTIGVRVLSEVSQVRLPEVTSYHMGYVLGPRLNASGRIGNQYTSTRLLSTDNIEKAREFAREAHEINTKRQELTKKMIEEAEKAIKVIGEKIIVVAVEEWEDGIIGLVAGKLMNKYHLPTLAISIDTNKGQAKGSARSFGEFDITGFLAKMQEHLDRFGGHHNAAGFSLSAANLPELINKADALLKTEYQTYIPQYIQYVDSLIVVSELQENFFLQLSNLEPFGHKNESPLFAVKGKVETYSFFGQQGTHLRIQLKTAEGPISALAFDALHLATKLEQGSEVVLIGRPKRDEYRGQMQLSFFVDEILDTLPMVEEKQ